MPKLRISADGTGLRPPNHDALRHTKSFDDGMHSPTKEYRGRGYDSFELQEGEGEIKMEFDPVPESSRGIRRTPSAYGYENAGGDGYGGGAGRNVWADYDDYDDDEFAPRKGEEGEMTMTFA